MKCDVPRHQFCVMRRQQPSNRLPLVQGKAFSQANELNWSQKDRSMKYDGERAKPNDLLFDLF